MNILIVGGNFDDEGGRPSGIINKIANRMSKTTSLEVELMNGGHWQDLVDLSNNINAKFVFWAPNVPNNKVKIVETIKDHIQKSILIISKNNLENKYHFKHLVAKCLKVRANLLVEYTMKDEVFNMRLLDPIGNVFADTTDIDEFVGYMVRRLKEIVFYTRRGSKKIGSSIQVPERKEFFEIIKEHANSFHELTHIDNSDRMVGNVSFRCEKGMPAFRHKGVIYVSRRNVDKKYIDKDSFVGILESFSSDDKVMYCGDNKPSVDSPIQIILFKALRHINYIFHGHVYLENAPYTKECIPCGCIEEASTILSMVPEDSEEFMINLLGHGFIAGSKDPKFFNSLKYISRPYPEYQL